jgi:hypothetical protein
MKCFFSLKRFACKATSLLTAKTFNFFSKKGSFGRPNFKKLISIGTVILFVSSGISIPPSFAGANELILNETQQPVGTLTLEQANEEASVAEDVIPSGSAIEDAGPLSAAVPNDVEDASGSNALADSPEVSVEALDQDIEQVAGSYPEPVLTPAESKERLPDSENLYAGRYKFDQIQGNGITVSQTSPGIYTYHKVAPFSWAGGAVNPPFNGNGYSFVTLEARSLSGGSNGFILEVKNGSYYILRQTVSLQGTDWHTFQFFFPKNTFSVNFIAFSNTTNDFQVRSLRFSDTPVFSGTAPVQVVQTSSRFSNANQYQLVYTLNGVSFQEELRLKNGNNTVTRSWVNAFGKRVTHVFSVLLDKVKPTGSININSNALYTASRNVTLNLSAVDGQSGVKRMSFSLDGVNWTTPEAYATSKTFKLPAGDGKKTVYVKYFDKAGNVSLVYSKSIILDTRPPAGTIQVNGGVQFINQTAVTLNLSAVDAGSGLKKMCFSTDGKTWTAAEAYAASRAWTFPSGDGAKKVYVKFLDKSGKWSVAVSVTVTLDTVKPTGSIAVNSGALYTKSPEVVLNLLANDAASGIATMSFSTDNVHWTAPEAYAASRSFTFPAGDGTKNIYVKYYDKAGNASVVYSKSITLDTIAPVVVLDPATPSTIYKTSLTISYTSDGIAKTKFFEGLVAGENTLTIKEKDLAWNETIVNWVLTVDIVPPGWTRAASNPDFCFRLQEEDGVTKLLLLNLGSGEQIEAAELPAGAEYPRFQDIVDVSPSGPAVIYGILQSSGDSNVFVQRVSDPAQKFSADGILLSVIFVPGSENARMDFQDGKSILLKIPDSPDELLQILEECKPNGVTSYFNATDGALERVAIQQPGSADPLPTVEIVRPVVTQVPMSSNQFTIKFDQAMKGVLYEVQFTTDFSSDVWQTAGSFVADHYGEILWQDPVQDRGTPVFYRVVAKEMTTAADLLTQINLLYFDPAFGMVDPTHEYPLEGWLQRDKTQPSNFGFYAYLLATIAAGDLVTSKISKTEAISRLSTMMDHLLEDQADPELGFLGLLPWFEYSGSDWKRMEGDYGNQVSFEDNTNLTNALAVAYGALLDESLAGDSAVHGTAGNAGSGILGKIDAFIANQEEGYSVMYNNLTKTFSQTMKIPDRFLLGTIDYFGAESSTPLLFLVLQYGNAFSEGAYSKLNFATRSYEMQDGSTRQVVAPFSGAFQMYWPSLLLPESQNPDLRNMLETYTDVQLDFAARNGHPGLLSAGYDIQAHDLLRGQLAVFNWGGGNVNSAWESNRLHITSTNHQGIGVSAIEPGLDVAGLQLQLRYASTTAVPNTRIEFKKIINGTLQTVGTSYFSMENTGGEIRTVNLSLPAEGWPSDLDEVVFVTQGSGASLDMSLYSFVLMDETYKIVYNFPLGIKEIALDQDSIVETTPSVYNLGAAYMFRPAQVESLLQGLIAGHRDLVSNHGMWEGKNMIYGKVVGEQVFNNMVTFTLGMVGTGPSYMNRYLENKGLTAKLESIWDPQTPVSVIERSTVYDFAYSKEGIAYKATAWKMSENVRASDREIRFTYQSATAIQHVKLELKHPATQEPIYTLEFDLPATGGAPGEFVLLIPESVLYWYISEMVVVFPEAMGYPSAMISRIVLAPSGVASLLAPLGDPEQQVNSAASLAGAPSHPVVAQELPEKTEEPGLEPQTPSIAASRGASFSKWRSKKLSKREVQQLQPSGDQAQMNLNATWRSDQATRHDPSGVSAFEQTTKLFREICVKLLS